MPSRFGPQPARAELFKQRISVRAAAGKMNVSAKHLSNVIQGYTHPCAEVRDGLPDLLGVPLNKLFTKAILSKDYNPAHRGWA